ncbi:nucleotide sugar dehydrogenase [Aureispira anguillae]|uniref:UDP-glucose 6-dehydrogenase n=1 Tax=Aureispira anguillae TaxID=2864201 RepID=A0A915YEJ8_9BACT|nr:nucleotide sugar dehydrogenase [Aureispira anguillae]BDS11595.1 nucleotide sugar dehydrogenase [Aureispira anguillae]
MINKTIAIVGLWHLGCVTAAALSESFQHIIGFDEDREKVDQLNLGKAPLFEPNLNELITKGISANRLEFVSDIEALAKADYVWITIDTPIDENDVCSLDSIEAIMQKLSDLPIKNYMISSQVPIGTTEKLLTDAQIRNGSKIAYIPENLQLGKAIEKFQNPDMTVIGANDRSYTKEIADLLSSIDKNPILCDLRTAELAKHAINSFLATSISFSNQLSDIAVAMQADAYQVVEIMKKDQRISNRMPLLPGPWFSGGTLARDIRSLQEIGRKTNKKTSLFDTVIAINEDRIDTLFKRIEAFTSLENKRVALLGLVYTEGTDTLRRSPGLQVIQYLNQYKAAITAFDPMVKETALNIELFDTAIGAIQNADVVLILKSGCAKGISVQDISEAMNGNILMDLWHLYEQNEVKNTNLIYLKPGCE